ncbi:isoleucyl-tRNA synthetase [Pirellula staleyi DSM 6068]|uniref:Isoleucine--tRNA ligase n=1 Tax=Pirellula staleyi (strain ATCC 27377 / DSM 6068 / ICPB 4128) TaxID=530564 RepID=D2QX99_PIRSD|nr:isoleucine--tRNA ligase [Pirellula staleyi]ADB17939.1 isoleucyl-tRNA synthetase [Pirellula staleyi DSM 6068]
MFNSVPASAPFPKLEQEVLQFWRENKIYDESLERRKDAERFVFFEGPPTANGMPHPGHCLTRSIKDLFPRYQTMRGKLCERKAGWDTHGLPVEVEVCKEMGIHSKEEIEAFGIEPFIHRCQASVWRYMQQWEKLTERLGFWIKLDQAYVTYHQSFVESVWWSLKQLFDNGLLYQGHKIVWWWAQGGTALSSGEVGQGYREVADPSVYVLFPLLDDAGNPEGTSLLVWTTTPWTLPSNQFAAVHPDLDYVVARDTETDQRIILAAALVETIAAKSKRPLEVVKTLKGSELLGRRYVPPYSYYYSQLGSTTGKLVAGGEASIAWRVVAADFVTTDSGSGVVHQAPAFGEVDFDVLVAEKAKFVVGEGPELICAVGPDGKFTAEAPTYQGRWVKDCDKEIQRELKAAGLLYHQEQYLHDYPFCWRADNDPLIQYPRRSWFIRTTKFRDEMLASNEKINWLPGHIKEGRFGNFLESNVDWALSRERFWGTPLPIWVCETTGQMQAIASYAELEQKPGASGFEAWANAKQANPELVEDLKVHKPYIDNITYDSPFATGAKMRRVSEVIDCWYDSGAMPFAQWGYPHKGAADFQQQFPADFISEAIDQTRGWFYSQLAISTMLFGKGGVSGEAQPREYPHPFKNCIVLGLMLGEDGQKMSKSKRNYREPNEIFDKYGADALRWYFFANQAPWTSIRYKEQSIKDSIPEFLLRLWNCYSFFVIYANIDGFDPSKLLADVGDGQLDAATLAKAKHYRPIAERGELDRWIMGELHKTSADVTRLMDQYDNFEACKLLNAFVDGLSNWFVRRSRERFWAADKTSPEKLDAYWTLYECLLTTAKLIAPFTPFLAETLWQNLARSVSSDVLKSVHLCDFPEGNAANVDSLLSERMKLLREIASLGLSARMANKLKVRQPLSRVEVILSNATHQAWLTEHDELLRDELNVKTIDYATKADEYITYQVQPNFKRLGPKIGKLLPACKAALGNADGATLLAQLQATGKVVLTLGGETLELDNEDIQVRLQAKEGWAAAQGSGCVVVLSTELTPALIREGYARDLVRLIQDRRKELGLDYSDRIEVGVVSNSEELASAVLEHASFIASETLATHVGTSALDCEAVETELGEIPISLYVRKV